MLLDIQVRSVHFLICISPKRAISEETPPAVRPRQGGRLSPYGALDNNGSI